MPHDISPFGERLAPGRRLDSLQSFMPLAAQMAGPAERRETALISLDRQWRTQPAITVVGEVPSVPALFETLLTWNDGHGCALPELLDMHRLICVSSGVPFRIDAAFDWFDCDHTATQVGVHLVEWIALDQRCSSLPRIAAGVQHRWPRAV